MINKIILWIFDSLINIEKFLRIVCLFFIMFLSLYWIQNLIGASWWWMMFLAPVLEVILDFVNSIYSVSFDFWGKTMEIKYFNSLVLMLVAIGALKLIDIALEYLKDFYDDIYRSCKKANEKVFNYGLQKSVDTKEKLALKYMVFIQTRIPNKYLSRMEKFDINEQNKIMNNFIAKKLNVSPMESWGGFIYHFDNFEKVDNILDVMYELLNSQVPLEYTICVQIGNDMNKIKQLAELQNWSKITISADTLYRYELNSIHKYNTTSLGIYQKESGILEVHEFINNL